jgi:uncharacterized protein (TIGR00299 family) protein
MGAAGDMLMASLLELHDNPTEFLEKLNAVGIPDVVVSSGPSVKHGITGCHIRVAIDNQEENPNMYDYGHGHKHEHKHNEHEHSHKHDHKHHEHKHSHGHEHHDHEHELSHKHHEHSHSPGSHQHNSYQDIEHLIGHLNLSDEVKKNSLAVYKLIAEAESHAHGVPVTQIHFHEVGEMDAVADIVGVCMLIEELAPDMILASPINVGSGHVRCAHGILPVPAPATVHVLRGVPIYSDNIVGELCTPTGAALLKHFVTQFDKMPMINVSKIGYGMGTKDFERANCLRAYLGTTNDKGTREEVTELICNLDDMTPEAVAFTQQLLLDEGALDVYITPIVMKKGRGGVMFTSMCYNDMKEKMISLIFKHTTTLGIREIVSRRYTLQREQNIVQTKYGDVEVKTAHGYGVTKSKPEYEDIAEIARNNHISIQDVLKEI